MSFRGAVRLTGWCALQHGTTAHRTGRTYMNVRMSHSMLGRCVFDNLRHELRLRRPIRGPGRDGVRGETVAASITQRTSDPRVFEGTFVSEIDPKRRDCNPALLDRLAIRFRVSAFNRRLNQNSPRPAGLCVGTILPW